jgi:hypothetical protein
MAQVMLELLVVIVSAGLLVAGMGSLALVILELRKAPEGYEDDHGFHAVPGSMTQNTRRPRSFAALRAKPILAGFL